MHPLYPGPTYSFKPQLIAPLLRGASCLTNVMHLDDADYLGEPVTRLGQVQRLIQG
jgi:hypothetical protein